MKKISKTAAAVKRRAAELAKMTDEEYFCRPEFSMYLADVLSAVVTASRNAKLTFQVIAVPDDTTAFTDGDLVCANLLSPIVTNGNNRAEKFDLLVGTITHECGHVLYTDFNSAEKFYADFLKYGLLSPGIMPEKFIEELSADRGLREYCIQYLKNLDNIFEDSYIEYYLKKYFKGYVASCLRKTRKQVMAEQPTLNELFAKVEEGSMKLSLTLVAAFFYYAFQHRFNCVDLIDLRVDHPAVYDEFFVYADKIQSYAERLEREPNGKIRFQYLTKIFEVLYPLIKAEYDERKEESSGEGESGEDESSSESSSSSESGSSGSDSSDFDSDEDTDSSESDSSGSDEKGSDSEEESKGDSSGASSDDDGSSSDDEGSSSTDKADEGSAESSSSSSSSVSKPSSTDRRPGSSGSNPAKDLEEEMEKMRKESGIAPKPINRKTAEETDKHSVDTEKPDTDISDPTELAKAELEAEKNVSERMRTMDVFNEFDRTLILNYEHEVTKADRTLYSCEYKEIAAFANRTVRMLESVLTERQKEGWVTGQLYGKRFDAKSAYLENGRVFKRELVPDGTPKVAFGVLIDESGSMNSDRGRRIEMARKTAIALEDILRRLDVPRLIVGHTADVDCNDGSVTINKYVEFDSYRDDDRFRLGKARARCENHDACAIAYTGERLMERSEEKVLIVLSDGQPCASGFWGPLANRQTKEVVDSLRKKGITVIAAALGGSYGELVNIYGEPYIMDIESLEDLPVQVTKLVKKYVVKRRA